MEACKAGQGSAILYLSLNLSITWVAGGDAKPRRFMPLKSNSKEQLLDAAKAQSEQKFSMGARRDILEADSDFQPAKRRNILPSTTCFLLLTDMAQVLADA